MDIRQPVSTNYGNWIEKFGELWKRQAESLKEAFGAEIEQILMPPNYPTDVPIIYVNKSSLPKVMAYLKDQSGFEYAFLSDITATDEEVEPRFEVVYNLFSHRHLSRIRIKTRVKENEQVPTLVSVWKGANWAEREVYDMFGIRFEGHPDLRRILMDGRWVGYPLRKDYPLRGYQVFSEPEPIDPKLLE